MAIFVEEGQGKVSVASIVLWLVILAIIAAAVYYVFFNTPTLVDVIAPSNLKNIEPLSRPNVDPNAVINGPSFRSLKQYITPLRPGNAGRPNPFLAP